MKDIIDLRNEVWDLFDKLSDKKKVEWLLEFECIFESVRQWEDDVLLEEIKRLRGVKNE